MRLPKEAHWADREGPEEGNKDGTRSKRAMLQGKARSLKFAYLEKEKSKEWPDHILQVYRNW